MNSFLKTWKLLLLANGLVDVGHGQIAPSSAPTISAVPTLRQPKISDPLADVTIDDNNSRIVLDYNISDLAYDVKLLDLSCNESVVVADTSIGLNFTSDVVDTDFSGDTVALNVDLDLKPDGLSNDPDIFNDTNPEESTLGFCVRVNLLLPKEQFLDPLAEDEVLTFHNTKVRVIANTTVSFEVTNIDLEIEDPTKVNKTVDFTYDINAYQCDRTGTFISTPVGQSESVHICIETDAEVTIRDVKNLVFEKDAGTTLTAIRDRNSNAVTSKRQVNNKKWIVQSRLVSRFYSNDGTVTVSATGAVIMGFGGTTARRLQAYSDENGESGFNAQFQLAPLDEVYAFDETSSSTMSGGFTGFLTFSIIALFATKLF